MNEIKTGGPAFPTAEIFHDEVVYTGGMTLRDYFAAKAMQSLIEKVVLRDQATGMPRPIVTEVQEKIAIGAYAYADAMIEAREAK
jgi:hypothetical protein